MSSSVPVPQKQDLPKEIWRLATTLSNEMQSAATQKARELGFDLNKGRITFDETLINLSSSRDTILDAVDKGKLVQLPLKLQFTLLSQIQRISEALTSMVNGTDSVLPIEDAVDEITATIWQYNLHNLSSQVLGFHQKMNELKAQEVLIRRVRREAEEFEIKRAQADELAKQLADLASSSKDQTKSIQASADQVSGTLAKVIDQEQKLSALSAQGLQHDSAAAQYAANTKTAAADVDAIANRAKTLQSEIETAKSDWTELSGKVRELLPATEKRLTEAQTELQQSYEQLKTGTETQIGTLRERLTQSVAESAKSVQERLDAAVAAIQKRTADAENSAAQLLTDTSTRLSQAETNHEARLVAQLNDSSQKAQAAREDLGKTFEAKFAEIAENSNQAISKNTEEFNRLTSQLDELEGRIRTSIERATGYTLFHSFQKRQEDLATSKRKWGIALACAVAVSLIASGIFIWSLRYVQVYNAAFYLKLSIALPLVYAIAFCNLQYSRERRLEEEYAFKSTVSISLEPYQKLVEKLIDKEKPEERLRFAQFIIESVNRVFTSPTERVFEDHAKDKNSAEKIIKAIGDVVEPFAKGIQK